MGNQDKNNKSIINVPNKTIPAMPGPAARLIERNNPESLKVTSTREFAREFYNPSTYLKPFATAKRSQSTVRGGVKEDLVLNPSIMSLHHAKVEMNKFGGLKSQMQKGEVERAASIPLKEQFTKLKECLSSTVVG
jgi:hypothetical protein